jgi:hypothetical protein
VLPLTPASARLQSAVRAQMPCPAPAAQPRTGQGGGRNSEHAAEYPGAFAPLLLPLLHDFPDPGKSCRNGGPIPSDTVIPHTRVVGEGTFLAYGPGLSVPAGAIHPGSDALRPAARQREPFQRSTGSRTRRRTQRRPGHGLCASATGFRTGRSASDCSEDPVRRTRPRTVPGS